MTQGLPPTVEQAVLAFEHGIAEASGAELTTIIGELEQLKAAAWARLVTPASNGKAQAGPSGENGKLLTPEEAAELLSVKVSWLYHNWRGLPFARKLSRKALRFNESGLHRWQATRKG